MALRSRWSVWALFAVLTLGCGNDDDEPADFRGAYTVAVTNRDNPCGFPAWTVGSTLSGVPFNVTQSGSTVSGDVGGFALPVYDGLLGSHTFTGTGSGNALSMGITGTATQAEGTTCTFTVNASLAATLDGDTLSGNVTYSKVTKSGTCTNPTCRSVQAFNGTRPPR